MSTPQSATMLEYDSLEPTRYFHNPDLLNRVHDAAFTIRGDSNRAERIFPAVYKLLREQIVSIEFVKLVGPTRDKDLTGAILRSKSGEVLIHVEAATLGYHGSGSILSRVILVDGIGFGRHIFDELNALAARIGNQRYDIVIPLT